VTTLAATAGVVVLSWAASRFPQTFVVGALLTGMVPQVLSMTTALPADFLFLPGGVQLVDLLLVGMGGAAVWGIAFRVGRTRVGTSVRLVAVTVVLFGGWVLGEVARNLGVFGTSALGEFRFEYLILVLPLFCAVRLSDERLRKRMATVVWGLSVPIVLAATPVIGALKGSGIGPESKFLGASISLALLYGVVWMLAARRERLVRVPGLLVAVLAGLGAVMVFIDANRSVWLALLVVFCAFLLLGELRLDRFWAWSLGALALIAVVATIASSTGIDTYAYLTSHGRALVDPYSDPNSLWRINLWQANLRDLADSPFIGRGFGAFWNVYVPEISGSVTVAPHSIYVQTAVKLGAVGLALYLWMSTAMVRLLRKAQSRADRFSASDRLLITMGIVVCATSFFYHLAYSLEYAGLMWIGLGLAAAIHGESSSSPSSGIGTSQQAPAASR
jgi:O-antigen ligase